MRRNRESAKVTRFVIDLLAKRPCVTTQLLDLKRFDLPMMEETLRFSDDPPLAVREYPRALKNALDCLRTNTGLNFWNCYGVSSMVRQNAVSGRVAAGDSSSWRHSNSRDSAGF